jgi:hypothetical protein
MSLSKINSEHLTQEEWKEMDALRKAINYDPRQVSPQKMEEFTALFVRSLYGKGNSVSSQTK